MRNLDSTTALEQKYGKKVSTVFVDFSQPESIKELARQTQDVNIVVNNAGMLTMTNPLDVNVEASFRKELEVNVFGLLRMAQVFTPILEKNGDFHLFPDTMAKEFGEAYKPYAEKYIETDYF